MRYIGIAATVATMALIFCAHSSGFAADQKADMIFHGGSIITSTMPRRSPKRSL